MLNSTHQFRRGGSVQFRPQGLGGSESLIRRICAGDGILKDKDEDLAMAEHAEKAALQAQSIVAKQCWLTIAREYRALAAERRKLQRPDPKWDS